MTADERTAELCRLVHLIVSSIADDVGSIVIRPVSSGQRRVFIEVFTGKGDQGKLIGRDGRVADAIRQFVRAYQLQHGGVYGIAIRDQWMASNDGSKGCCSVEISE